MPQKARRYCGPTRSPGGDGADTLDGSGRRRPAPRRPDERRPERRRGPGHARRRRRERPAVRGRRATKRRAAVPEATSCTAGRAEHGRQPPPGSTWRSTSPRRPRQADRAQDTLSTVENVNGSNYTDTLNGDGWSIRISGFGGYEMPSSVAPTMTICSCRRATRGSSWRGRGRTRVNGAAWIDTTSHANTLSGGHRRSCRCTTPRLTGGVAYDLAVR